MPISKTSGMAKSVVLFRQNPWGGAKLEPIFSNQAKMTVKTKNGATKVIYGTI